VTAAPQPSGTVTLVFTDIEGSTGLLEELGTDVYREALAAHRRVVREACNRHSGYEVDYEGDAFFYAFQSAQQAVNAVSEAMAGLAEGPIRIRVGVHTGEPALDPPKYVGLDVHRAARIMSAAHGGQVLLSPSTVALLEPGFVTLGELGQHRLKDLSAPIVLHQLELDGLSSEFPPLKTLRQTNLPTPATPFLGREREVAEITERLIEPATRLLTLTGPGGTGKTRLALQAAAEASDRFPDGVYWVPLAPLRDPALVLPTIASMLELGEQPGSSPMDTVTRVLSGKKLLLLIDNLEHLLPAVAADVGALVTACPSLQVLATSRERLLLQAEVVNPIDALTHEDAVELLMARAAALAVRLSRIGSTGELADRLDRLPLAIELAAPRLKLFTPPQLLERLGERLDMLRGSRDADPRQQTLRATIAWSHDLLTEDEQQLFRRLAVFRGGCTLPAAEAVCDATVDGLQSLLDKSLLRRSDDTNPRFWMLEVIRDFATEQLASTPEDDAIRDRYAHWFFELAEPPNGNPWSNWCDRNDTLERELDNLRAVHERLVEHADTTRALQLAVNLFSLWESRDRFEEGDRWLERALDLPGPESPERGVAYDMRSTTAELRGNPDGSRQYAEEAVRILRAAGTTNQLAMALQGRAAAERDDDPTRAVSIAEEALRLARSTGDAVTLRPILSALGTYVRDMGAHDRARRLLGEARQLALELGDDYAAGASLDLADLELDCSHLDDAWRLYLEEGQLSVINGGRYVLGTVIGGLAAVAARRDDRHLASELWAAFERWEFERGSTLHPSARNRYVAALADIGSDDDERVGAHVPTLEEALRLAQELGT
jgi:predicted ATPase/class 3 adenylate cyclase